MNTYTTLISAPQALAESSSRNDLLWLDARFDLADTQWGLAAYHQGHLPHAQYIDLERDLSAPASEHGRHPLPAREAWLATVRRLGLSKQHQVLLYDDGQMMYAARAWMMLRWLGHAHVAVVDGGLNALLSAGARLSSVSTPADHIESADFMAQKPLLGLVDSATLLADLAGDTPRYLLVDARTPERYAGQPHALDPRSGHIPGARNRFFQLNNQANGGFLPMATLQAQWQAVLGTYRPDQVVHYCGSGVSACVNLLAMEYAGLSHSQLYVGSWSEWAAHADNPIA